MTHSHLKAVPIANETVFSRAVIVAEYLFVHVAEQMERLYRNIRTFQTALEKAPEILQTVCVDLPLNVALCVVNRLVRKVRRVADTRSVGRSWVAHPCSFVLGKGGAAFS